MNAKCLWLQYVWFEIYQISFKTAERYLPHQHFQAPALKKKKIP
jgi:hypothetical protein